jgi:hypothetical protein
LLHSEPSHWRIRNSPTTIGAIAKALVARRGAAAAARPPLTPRGAAMCGASSGPGALPATQPPPSPGPPPVADADADADPFLPVRIPPARQQLGARVRHVILESDGPLSAAAAAQLRVPRGLLLELMRFGAVYYAPVMPKPGPNTPLAPQQLEAARAAHAAGIKVGAGRWAPAGKGGSIQRDT